MINNLFKVINENLLNYNISITGVGIGVIFGSLIISCLDIFNDTIKKILPLLMIFFILLSFFSISIIEKFLIANEIIIIFEQNETLGIIFGVLFIVLIGLIIDDENNKSFFISISYFLLICVFIDTFFTSDYIWNLILDINLFNESQQFLYKEWKNYIPFSFSDKLVISCSQEFLLVLILNSLFIIYIIFLIRVSIKTKIGKIFVLILLLVTLLLLLMIFFISIMNIN
jgi:hypothetical protein